MTVLTTIEQILAEGRDPAYLVFAMPDWEHFHPTDLPAPIAGLDCPKLPRHRSPAYFDALSPDFPFGLDKFYDEVTSALEIAPVFRIGFNEEAG